MGADDLVLLPSHFAPSPQGFARMQAQEPVTPRDATSVVLVRDGEAGVEVFLLHRAGEMAFAGGMTVFPGGGASAGDRGDVPRVGSAPAWPETDPASADALAVTAARETFEETGVLLAGTPDGALADPDGLAAERDALVAGTRDLGDVLRDAGLVLRDDLLLPWARWITPPGMPRRYDTRFFLATLPAGQEADGRTTEAVAAGWSTPTTALAEAEAGHRRLMPVTWAVLRDLEVHGDDGVAGLRDRARTRRPRPVVPRVIPHGPDAALRLAVPAHAGTFLDPASPDPASPDPAAPDSGRGDGAP